MFPTAVYIQNNYAGNCRTWLEYADN